ncbi:cytochrome b561, DM13 and DOMON domain-containing protein At5g54830 [Chenopodium quinoa]|uniref:cytochrome b561, DM13 and DOMON domain-containing protein At5g54830 n=1 Tax=Chenopodium quinoa TaxID=63459 RepID=UPI000B7825A6|nr:cytochrome b561, DM13 and DOMON domain-containing protein At5g54830 [Chenopodium quinoa]
MAYYSWVFLGFLKPLFMCLIVLHLCCVSVFGSSDSTCSNDTSLAGFRSEFMMLQHQLRGVFTILDNCSFRVSEFDMLPGSDHVRWWGAVGDNFVNLTNGFIISDENLDRTYNNDSFVVHLRSNVSWDQIKVVAVWDSPTASDFGHVVLHNLVNGLEISAPPAPAPVSDSSSNNATNVKKWRYEQPTMFENCKILSPKYRVRWTLREDDNVIDIGLEAVTGIQNYMAFGWANPKASSGYMLLADVAVTGFTEEGMPFAEDYYITDYSECSVDENHVARGVCPDSLYNGSDSVNDTHLVYGHRKDGVSFIRYQRPLKANDPKNDVPVNQMENATVIWALGRIKPPDYLRPYSLPQNHGGPQFETYGYLLLNVSEHINDCMGPLDAVDKEDQDLVIADANAPLLVTSGTALHYPNPPNPSKVLYINKKEAPLLRVERGVQVKFSVQAGHDVPFYITSDPLGGNATERNISETIYAGRVEVEGVPASPKELVWTPHRNTPDLVYYQSAYEQKMGWKVQVVDGGLSDMYNNSVVLDDQQASFFWTLSENSISIAARGERKSGYLAIGFGSEMVNSFAYVGWFDGDVKGRVDTYWIDGRGASDVHPTKENLTYVRCKSENGVITLEFTRPLNPSCPKKDERPECKNIIDPTTPLKVIWAVGSTWSSDPLTEKNMHSAHSSRPVRVMLNRGSAEVEQDLRPVLAVHGFMMFLAWGILLPAGVLTARYLKHMKGDGWYKVHVYLQYSGLAIVLLGFLFAVAELKGLFMTSLHVKLGMAGVVLACFQPINASLRPKKASNGESPSLKRVIWEYSHVIIGRSAIMIGMAALLTGMKHLGERYEEDVRRLTWALICWFLFGGVTILYLEYREKQHGDRSSGRGKWVLGNVEDDSADLLSPTGTYAEKEAHLSDRMEVQLEPLNR